MNSQFKTQFTIRAGRRRLRVRVEERDLAADAKVERALASLTRNTRRNYRSFLRRFDSWRRGRAVKDDLLADYCLHLLRKGRAPATIRATANAVTFRERALDKPDPRGRETKQAFRAIRRRGAGRGKGSAPGLTLEQVERVIRAAEDRGDLWAVRDAAIVALGFYCGLRIGEAAGLRVDDVRFLPDGTGTLRIRRSKTDQSGEGAVVHLPERGAARVRAWLDASGVTDGALFRQVHFNAYRPPAVLGGMKAPACARAVKLRARAVGLKISSHSLRRSFAQHATLMGASLQEVANMGRWQSPAVVARYCRNEEASQSAARRVFDGEAPRLRAVR